MKETFRRFITFAAGLILLAFLTACPAPAPKAPPAGQTTQPPTEELFPLTILHTNDVHARVMQFNSHGSTCNEEEAAADECFGGVARRATVINRIRGEQPNVLLVDAGDEFQGTLFYTQFKGREAYTFMNMLGYDAMTLGNHEFDDGPEVLSEFIKGLDFPVVSVNVDARDEPLLKDLIVPWKIVDMAHRRIGIIGLTTEDTNFVSKPGPNVYFDEIEAAAQSAAYALRAQDVNIIIALSHSGLSRDKEIAGKVSEIDVIVGGHTHSLLSNTDPEAEGPYPVVINSPSGEPVLIVTAKSWGKYLGDLNVEFNAQGIAKEWSGEPILLDSSVPEDEAVLAEVMVFNAEVDPLTHLVVGQAGSELVGDEDVCRHYECNLGDLITDAMLWDTKHSGIQIALFNGGGIRSGIRRGDITLANVLEVMPFGDTEATLGLTGADLRAVLEFGVSRAENPQNESTGRFLQVAGMRYTWDPSAEVGSRIVSVEIQNEDGTFSPLEDEKQYKIVTSDYLRGGHDGFTILLEKAIDPYDFGRVISDVLVDYLTEFSPVNPEVGERIKRVE
jgi:5'-nucleotidase